MTSKTKILFIETSMLGGGSCESLYELLLNLNRKEFEPTVVLFSKLKLQNKLTKLKIKNYTLHDILLSKTNKTFQWYVVVKFYALLLKLIPSFSIYIENAFHFRTIQSIIRIVKSQNIQLIHLNNQINRHFFGSIVAKKTHTKCISYLRSHNTQGFNAIKARFANRYVSQYIAYLDDIKSTWVKQGISPEKCDVIYNAITPFKASPLNLYQEFQIPTQYKYIIGAIGQFLPVRRLDFLIKVFAELHAKRKDVYLLLVGKVNTSYSMSLINLAHDLKINNHIKFADFHSNPRGIISALDVLTLPYSISPFGRVLLEAWQVKTPVVASNIYPIEKIIKHNETGLLAIPESKTSFIEMINILVSNKYLKNRITENAYAHCNENFNMSQNANQLQRIYSKLAEPVYTQNSVSG
jgi:glycosyltransferase involved in cell wall biosynthesis